MVNIFFSHLLPIKQPIKIEKRNISTPKLGVQDLIVTQYGFSPQHIPNVQYFKLKKIGECKIKPVNFQILPAQVSVFSQIWTLQVRTYAINA